MRVISLEVQLIGLTKDQVDWSQALLETSDEFLFTFVLEARAHFRSSL